MFVYPAHFHSLLGIIGNLEVCSILFVDTVLVIVHILALHSCLFQFQRDLFACSLLARNGTASADRHGESLRLLVTSDCTLKTINAS